MKTVIKDENAQFLFITLKNVTCLTGLANRPGTPKPWAIAQGNSGKMRKRRFFGHNYQTCTRSYRNVNRHETSKLWAITHENSHKRRKRGVFVHNSQQMYWVLRAMQIALEPQSRGQQLLKTMVKCENDKFLVIISKLYWLLRLL